ncbi:MAG: hypothetical protein PVJ57_14290 [Phycisphaerae bacterium]|jgi:hypothetical protein
MKTAVSVSRHAQSAATTLGASVPFDYVDTPGAYVCNWDGHLLRVPRGALSRDSSPAINIVGSTPLMVTKISDDPDVSVAEAKRLAADFSITADF